jgi:hypothetical protein
MGLIFFLAKANCAIVVPLKRDAINELGLALANLNKLVDCHGFSQNKHAPISRS